MQAHPPPPLLPMQWSSAYVSYWSPMLPGDQMTSGYCWFNYARDVCRIDGLFNPWPEKERGEHLWMSEVGDVARGQGFKRKMVYWKKVTPIGEHLCETLLPDERSSFHELFLPRAVLMDGNARHAGCDPVLGQLADVWTIERPHKAPLTLYLQAGTNLLLRMVSGNDKQHVSVRDFPNVFVGDIPESVFAMPRTPFPPGMAGEVPRVVET
ncbi:violacein biosynthesis enzyme VioE [Myxococcus sp. CA040A]|uniref:violacein biosynthesis enzyme VioE n=1 Tax=Myxococcus sp. CA040A TaxID=2741738 RepID=UPI00157B403F|nr:violacein biosynthesis enzyme VioE [Myxococcus sp. CA040A]NTX08252.1 violacein biosynthesis enzyme VioE [Myxococcus sp. CA040A]